jgi:hypothetical protein
MEFEQVESLVDGLGESEIADEQLDSPDATTGYGLCPGGGLIVNVRGGKERPWRRGGDRFVEALVDFALADGMASVWNRFHSKSPCGLGQGPLSIDPMCRKRREISRFPFTFAGFGSGTNLGKGLGQYPPP